MRLPTVLLLAAVSSACAHRSAAMPALAPLVFEAASDQRLVKGRPGLVRMLIGLVVGMVGIAALSIAIVQAAVTFDPAMRWGFVLYLWVLPFVLQWAIPAVALGIAAILVARVDSSVAPASRTAR